MNLNMMQRPPPCFAVNLRMPQNINVNRVTPIMYARKSRITQAVISVGTVDSHGVRTDFVVR